MPLVHARRHGPSRSDRHETGSVACGWKFPGSLALWLLGFRSGQARPSVRDENFWVVQIIASLEKRSVSINSVVP